MLADGARWRVFCLLIGAVLCLGACAHGHRDDADVNTYPANYRADILAAMHAYLSDPTDIRDTGVSEPTQKPVPTGNRYVACVRFNAKKSGKDFVGVKVIAAVFVDGRFDRFLEAAHEQCDGATYASFPELGKLSR